MAADHPHLNRAPIVEGLVDLRVRLPEGFDVHRLADFNPQIAEEYPRLETQHIYEGRLHFSPETGQSTGETSSTVHGFRRLSEDGLNIVQFRRDGFTFSRLAPYETWERMYSEAMRLWTAYVVASEPHGVTRLATRFINRIYLPLGLEMDEYIRSAPQVPDALPQALASFMVKYVSVSEEERLVSNVTISTEQKLAQDEYPVILDIDCIFPNLDLSADDEDEIDAAFDKLHDMKNDIFFETLTPTALAMFK